MRWTENAPAEPGWYWQRAFGPGVTRVVHVDWSRTDDSVSKFLAVRGYVTGTGIGGGMAHGRVLWAGPIEPPTEGVS